MKNKGFLSGVAIPPGYYSTSQYNGNGTLYRPNGSTSNAYSIRIMGATSQYPNGYVVVYGGDKGLQPLTIYGKPGNNPATTHITYNL